MTLEELNALADGDLAGLLRVCADVDSWVENLVAGRPYADTDVVMARAVHAAAGWTAAEVEHAVADHPRIGERPDVPGAAGDLSRSEQAGVDPGDADVLARLADGNRRYEEQFGRVHLVRAAGRTAGEMLSLLEQRLTSDAQTEAEETKRQLAEIAVLRLRALIVDPGPGPGDSSQDDA